MNNFISKYLIGGAAAKLLAKTPEMIKISGILKPISKSTAKHLEKVAKATGDERIIKLAEIAKDSVKTGRKFPEEFSSFVDGISNIGKTVVLNKSNILTDSVKPVKSIEDLIPGIEKVTKPASINSLKLNENTEPLTNYIKNQIKLAANFSRDSDVKQLYKTISKTTRENKELPKELVYYLNSIFKKSPNSNKRINLLNDRKELDSIIIKLQEAKRSISGGSFSYTPMMRDEILYKYKGSPIKFPNNKEITKAFRDNFGEKEYPLILDYLTRLDPEIALPTKEEIASGVIPNRFVKRMYGDEQYSGDLRSFYEMGDTNANKLRFQRAIIQAKYPGRKIGFTPMFQIIRKNPNPNLFSLSSIKPNRPNFIREYAFTVDGKPIPEFRIRNIELHHGKALSQLMSDAIIKSDDSQSIESILKAYNDSKSDNFIKQFIPLTKELHIGKNLGIHSMDVLNLNALQSYKPLAYQGGFDSSEKITRRLLKRKLLQIADLIKPQIEKIIAYKKRGYPKDSIHIQTEKNIARNRLNLLFKPKNTWDLNTYDLLTRIIDRAKKGGKLKNPGLN